MSLSEDTGESVDKGRGSAWRGLQRGDCMEGRKADPPQKADPPPPVNRQVLRMRSVINVGVNVVNTV